MTWINPLDEQSPQDIEFVSDGARQFRVLKAALIERLSTIFRGFPDDHPTREGENLLFPSAGAMIGTEAERPDSPDREGHIWISTDNGRVYYGDRNGIWKLVPSTGPNAIAPLTDVGSSILRNASGTFFGGPVSRILAGRVTQIMTDSSGFVTVPLGTLPPGDWHVSQMIPGAVVSPIPIQLGMLWDHPDAILVSTDPVTNEFKFRCIEDGAVMASQSVSFSFMIPCFVPPAEEPAYDYV